MITSEVPFNVKGMVTQNQYVTSAIQGVQAFYTSGSLIRIQIRPQEGRVNVASSKLCFRLKLLHGATKIPIVLNKEIGAASLFDCTRIQLDGIQLQKSARLNPSSVFFNTVRARMDGQRSYSELLAKRAAQEGDFQERSVVMCSTVDADTRIPFFRSFEDCQIYDRYRSLKTQVFSHYRIQENDATPNFLPVSSVESQASEATEFTNYYVVELKDIAPELRQLNNFDMSRFSEGIEIDLRVNTQGQAFHALYSKSVNTLAFDVKFLITDTTVAIDHIRLPLEPSPMKYAIQSFTHHQIPLEDNGTSFQRNWTIGGHSFCKGIILMVTRKNESSLLSTDKANGLPTETITSASNNAFSATTAIDQMLPSANIDYTDSFPLLYDYIQLQIGADQYKNVIPVNRREKFYFQDALINANNMFGTFYNPHSLAHMLSYQFVYFIPVNQMVGSELFNLQVFVQTSSRSASLGLLRMQILTVCENVLDLSESLPQMTA